MRGNIVEPGRPQMAVWHMHIACWIPKTTYTVSEYVIFNVFPLQQLLHEGASMLGYSTFLSCLVIINVKKCK
jgi:hypothetical protein